MENETGNLSKEIKSNNSLKYDSSKKTKDLMIGCFGGGGSIILLGIILSAISIEITLIVLGILLITSIIYFFYKERHFISIGLILAVIIPLIVFGSCLALFQNI
jgi:hypothetical protein